MVAVALALLDRNHAGCSRSDQELSVEGVAVAYLKKASVAVMADGWDLYRPE